MVVPNLPERARALRRRLPAELGQRVGTAVLGAVDFAIERKWSSAQERAAQITGATVDQRISTLSRSYAQELGTVGAVTGASAAVPAFGTGVALSAGIAEFSWFTVRASELILTIAALHGHTRATVEERRAWILSILVFGDSASKAFTRLAGEVGKGLGEKATNRIPLSVLRGVNSSVGRTILTKYGTKRGVIALGTALPLGIGAVIGGTTNYAAVRLLARHANKFFKNLPYTTILEIEPADSLLR